MYSEVQADPLLKLPDVVKNAFITTFSGFNAEVIDHIAAPYSCCLNINRPFFARVAQALAFYGCRGSRNLLV